MIVLLALLLIGTSFATAEAAEPRPKLTVTAVGDLMISRAFLKHADQIRKLSLRGDVVFANFEGVLGEPAVPSSCPFCSPMQAATLFKDMRVNLVSLANNHALDRGIEGYRATATYLAQFGFRIVGSEGRGIVAEIRGRRVRVIGFSFGGPNDVNDVAAIPAVVGQKDDELVIVSAHMGGEDRTSHRVSGGMEYFAGQKRGDVVQFSRRCIDAGADLVLGHGPHVPRGLELYRNKLIVYSLGNFVFDYPGAALHPHAPGYAISIELDSEGDFSYARIDSYDLEYGIPAPDERGGAYALIRRLTISNIHDSALAFPGHGVVQRRTVK